MIHNKITMLSNDFLMFTHFARTRGHCYKVFKGYSMSTTMHMKYFFSNRINEIWNALSSTVVEASSLNGFKRLSNCVDVAKYCLF